MINSLLIVCVGNICRSPAVEALFQMSLVGGVHVSSAGLGALVGKGVDPNMMRCLKNDNMGSFKHSAKQFTREMGGHADLILVMENQHVDVVTKMAPELAGKVMLLGKWNNNQEIEDPYRMSEEFFEIVYSKIKGNVSLWLPKLI